MKHPEAETLLAEFGIRIVPANVVPGPGETRAVATVGKVIRAHWKRLCKRHEQEHGSVGYSVAKRLRPAAVDHARFTVMTLAETANSKAHLNESAFWAVSDLILLAEKNFPHLVTTDVDAWFQFFDGLPLGWLQFWSIDMDDIVPKRFALVGMVYERMKRVFGPLHRQPDLLDDRRGAA